MIDLSNRLRDLALAKHDDLSVASEAADLIDQQAAEIERLKEELQERIDQILHMSDTIDMREEQRDEWRSRAERLLVLATKWTYTTHHDWREITEAAQWFED